MPSPTPATKTKYFYPRPPRGGRQGDARQVCKRDLISIHALREEGDFGGIGGSIDFCNFYPRPPRGGRPAGGTPPPGAVQYFYPRPPRGGRRQTQQSRSSPKKFLSTPSARRATAAGPEAPGSGGISIHALREEGDIHYTTGRVLSQEFLSTPSARRATCRPYTFRHHPPYFYPRPPRGGRR